MKILSGLRSYGKVVYVFGTLPIIGFVVFACKILALFPLVRCFDCLRICTSFVFVFAYNLYFYLSLLIICICIFIVFFPGLIPVLALQPGLVPLHLQQKCNHSFRMILMVKAIIMKDDDDADISDEKADKGPG